MKLLFLILCLPIALSAYAPLVPKGRAVTTGSYSYFDTEHFFDKEGNRRQSYNSYQRYLTSIFIDAGITDTDSLSLHICYNAVLDHLNGDEFEFGDNEFAWKHALKTWDNAILSTELLAIIPFQMEYIPDLRYGRLGVEGSLLYAQTMFLWGFKTTIDGKIGYRQYFGFPSDQIRSHLAAWIDLSCRFQLLAETAVEYGFFNGKEPLNHSLFFYNANYRLWKGRLELNYYLTDRLALTAGYQYHFLGQNIAVGGEWMIRTTYCF